MYLAQRLHGKKTHDKRDENLHIVHRKTLFEILGKAFTKKMFKKLNILIFKTKCKIRKKNKNSTENQNNELFFKFIVLIFP